MDLLYRAKTLGDNSNWMHSKYIKQDRYNTYLLYTDEDGTIFDEWIKINKNTLSMFTGVYTEVDKKLVFEGDIVDIQEDVAKFFRVPSRGVVVYHKGCYFITPNVNEFLNTQSLYILLDYNLELRGNIVGNIYDNDMEDLIKHE